MKTLYDSSSSAADGSRARNPGCEENVDGKEER